ncbi:hypothetical protein [Nonomuraea solani]|uniref:hypothetical protein n=1 Tax=Nonomuraea solani TaxID=1144553 RepID=UPI00190EFBA4|nr:hypothetical protein [Nonomuraea solani]
MRVADIDTVKWTWTVRRQTTPSPGGLIGKSTKDTERATRSHQPGPVHRIELRQQHRIQLGQIDHAVMVAGVPLAATSRAHPNPCVVIVLPFAGRRPTVGAAAA